MEFVFDLQIYAVSITIRIVVSISNQLGEQIFQFKSFGNLEWEHIPFILSCANSVECARVLLFFYQFRIRKIKDKLLNLRTLSADLSTITHLP